METADTSEFKYFAFISYSRKDSRAAAFLHKKLEKFRIPIKRVPEEMRKGLRKFVRPVFRDKRDLEVGDNNFTDDVKQALQSSRFIIVLCSQNSAQSSWVSKEVEYFLAAHGNDLRKVVPIILSGEPGSGHLNTECLCECLLSEEVKPIIVKRNLPSMIPDEGEPEKIGWESGVVGVLSYMLKVRRIDVKAAIDAERIRYLKINTIVGVVFTTVFATLAIWAVKAERLATQNRLLAEANEKRAVENEQLAKQNKMRAEEQERIAIEQRDKAIASERLTRERNEQLLYIKFLHESLSSVRSYGVEDCRRFYALFDFTNKMHSAANASNSKDVYVRRFVKDNYCSHSMAGPKVISKMLEAMEHDLQARIADDQMLLDMRIIFYGNQVACIDQEIKTNTAMTVERKEYLCKVRDSFQSLQKTLELKKKQNEISQKIRMLRNKRENEEFEQMIDELIRNKDYVSAINAVKFSRNSDLKVSDALWRIISEMPVDEDMNELKVFYSLSERSYQSRKALDNNAYYQFVAVWDLRIAELFEKTQNHQEAAKYIEDAVFIILKHDPLQSGLCYDIPSIEDVYKNVDSSLLKQFFEASGTDKRLVAQNISCLYEMLIIQKILSYCSAILPQGKPYFSWYVRGRSKELRSTYEFHKKLCEFVAKRQDAQAIGTIRYVLSKLKDDLAKSNSTIMER